METGQQISELTLLIDKLQYTIKLPPQLILVHVHFWKSYKMVYQLWRTSKLEVL